MFSLRDQVALITGASRGLGRALAVEYAKQGAHLVINSRINSENDLRETEAIVKALNAPVLSVVADVSQRADVERLAAEALARFGRVHILVNNASALGPTPMPLLADTPIEEFENVLQT